MKRVDFVIANDGHHSAAALPVIRQLTQTGRFEIRVASLCEVRGLPSPVARYADAGVPLTRLMPANLRRSPASGQSGTGRASGLRRWAQRLLWSLVLRRSSQRFFTRRSNVVVLPNDGAFPYDRICRQLASRNIPYLILQEGIRFDTPVESRQGRSGATAFAIWGESSRAYFSARGAPADRVFSTGAPRFDDITRTDWTREAADLRCRLRLGARNLVFLSNPIDDLGFVSTDEKNELIRRFASALGELCEDPDFRLIVKLHRREGVEEVRAALSAVPHASSVFVVQDVPLYPLLHLTDGTVTFASTVGLEALLLGVRLAVLEIPGHGFAHDFVSSGAAEGLRWGPGLGRRVESWLAGPAPSEAASKYLKTALANRGHAAQAVSSLIVAIAGSDHSPALTTR